MSTLTGNDVMGLMEAYQAVYAPQELTEEQVWEEVEEWVNTLIEEGYDLSDYTWEEMFEAYIEEQGGTGSTAPRNQNVFKFPTSSAGTRRGAAAGTRSTSSPSTTPAPTAAAPSKPAAPTAAAPSKPAAPTAAAPSKPAAPTAAAPSKPAAPTAAAPSKPAAPRPSGTTTASKPAPTPAGPTKPAIGTTAGGTKFERRAATGAELRAAQAARAAAKAAGDTKGAEEAAVKAGVEAGKSASKPAVTSRPSGFGVPTAPLAAKLSASTSPTGGTPPKLTPRQAKLNMEMEYDAYDIVLEHLLDEGYADTEESALAIMTNMSEEWKQSIVEQDATSSMADRTRNAVANQRAGFHGDADALTRMQRTTQRSVNKATKPLKEV